MNRVQKKGGVFSLVLVLSLGCFSGGSSLYSSAKENVSNQHCRPAEGGSVDLRSKVNCGLRDISDWQASLDCDRFKQMRYEEFNFDHSTLGPCKIVIANDKWYIAREDCLVFAKGLREDIKAFKKEGGVVDPDAERRFEQGVQRLENDIDMSIRDVRRVFDHVLSFPTVEESMEAWEELDHVLFFPTVEEKMKAWEKFDNDGGFYAKIFFYERLCRVLDNPSGEWCEHEKYKFLQDLKNAIDTRAREDLRENTSPVLLFKFPPERRFDIVKDLDSKTKITLLYRAMDGVKGKKKVDFDTRRDLVSYSRFVDLCWDLRHYDSDENLDQEIKGLIFMKDGQYAKAREFFKSVSVEFILDLYHGISPEERDHFCTVIDERMLQGVSDQSVSVEFILDLYHGLNPGDRSNHFTYVMDALILQGDSDLLLREFLRMDLEGRRWYFKAVMDNLDDPQLFHVSLCLPKGRSLHRLTMTKASPQLLEQVRRSI